MSWPPFWLRTVGPTQSLTGSDAEVTAMLEYWSLP